MRRTGNYQNLFSHLLNLLGFSLDVFFEFVLPALHHLQPFNLVLQGLPAILHKHAGFLIFQVQSEVKRFLKTCLVLPRSHVDVCVVYRWNRFCYVAAPIHAPAFPLPAGCSAAARWPRCWPLLPNQTQISLLITQQEALYSIKTHIAIIK